MPSTAPISWGRVAAQALVAGLIAAAVFDFYVWLTIVLPAHSSMIALWQFAASTLLGNGAFADPSFAVLGVAVHAIVGIGWAGAYAYLAARQPSLNVRWYASGPVYGIVVEIVMQLILLAGNAFRPPPTPNAFLNDVIACAIFFGLPLAFVVKTLDARRAV
jgi:hypothetical protein